MRAKPRKIAINVAQVQVAPRFCNLDLARALSVLEVAVVYVRDLGVADDEAEAEPMEYYGSLNVKSIEISESTPGERLRVYGVSPP